MGQAPPLDELEARKRLAQARLELHRAEMALHLRQLLAPVRAVQSSVATVAANPMVRWAAAGVAGWVFFSGRWRTLGRAAGWVLPLALPQARRLVTGRAWGLASQALQWWWRRRRAS
jgi:hypothetical protein